LDGFFQKFTFRGTAADRTGYLSRYKRMWRNTVLAVSAVSLVTLLTITGVNYYMYHRSFRSEITQPIERIAAITKRYLESFLEERIAAAQYIVSREQAEDLYDPKVLESILERMTDSFGGIIDIGVVDRDGVMRAYAGPYDLDGKSDRDQDWFNQAVLRDVFVSDVFLGHRNLPHFIIAVNQTGTVGRSFIFRSTVDTEGIIRQIQIAEPTRDFDAFLINRSGLLQTPSRLYGEALDRFPVDVPPHSDSMVQVDEVGIEGQAYFMGTAAIEGSPFIFVILVGQKNLMSGWLVYQREMLAFLFVSIVATLLIIMWITTGWVRRLKESDLQREATLHNVEHTNRMASIGRLAAGVAHEINNPLAIINEKAGLITDILGPTPDAPHKNKLLQQTGSIIKSVTRCSEITHRLLGFARHMDAKHEPVVIDELIREVLGFLEKEAAFRDIRIEMRVSDSLPTVHSDKGQMQQLFLNLINNAFDAMEKGGCLRINITDLIRERVSVTIEDDGIGISKADLENIFEPFFTTKKSQGTGLGLSITYGIVKKLKGTIEVESEVGKGTRFSITLPAGQPILQEPTHG
jgi:two-component system NtrC family sensor kinase